MRVRRFLSFKKYSVLLLLACMLHLMMLETIRAQEPADSVDLNTAISTGQIEAWRQLILAKPDSRYEITLINGDKKRGKVVLAVDGILLNQIDYHSLSKSKHKSDRIEWNQIRSIEQTEMKVKVGATVKTLILMITCLLLVFSIGAIKE